MLKFALISLNLLTAVAVGISAYCWYKSAFAEVAFDPNAPSDEDRMPRYTMIIDDVDFHETLRLQSKWNKHAATFASAAAAFQCIATALSFVPD